VKLRKGENVVLTADVVRLEFGRRTGPGAPRADLCALLVSDTQVARGVGDFVHAGAPTHASGAVRYEGGRVGAEEVVDTLSVDLTSLESGIHSVLLVARGDGAPFSTIGGMWLGVGPANSPGTEVARFEAPAATSETVYILGECYRRLGGWRFRAVGQGYATGLSQLATAHGLPPGALPEFGTGSLAPPPPTPSPVATPAGRPVRPPTPTLVTTPAPVRLSKVTLTKEAPSVSLAKQGGTRGALRVSLNWRTAHRRWGNARGVDLDLCALFELTDGSKGVVQALGNAFGSLHRPPFILLDGDDRVGDGTGENLTVNLDNLASFRRILVFVTIYQGAKSFAGLHATVTLRPERGAEVDFTLDECTVASNVCALALLTRQDDDLVVQREARYLVPHRGVSPQRTVDYAYGWGLRWTPGRK